jgi:hypothetical protein
VKFAFRWVAGSPVPSPSPNVSSTPAASPAGDSNATAGTPPAETGFVLQLELTNGIIVGAIGVVVALAMLIVLVAWIVRHRRRRAHLPIIRAAREYRDDDGDVELDELESSNEGQPARGVITITPVLVTPSRAERNLQPDVVPGGGTDAQEEQTSGDEEDDAAPFHEVHLGDQAAEQKKVATRLQTGRGNTSDYIAVGSARGRAKK